MDNHYGLIVEAYSGIGGISLALKDKADEIIGIENVKDAVVNANANARANGAKHVSFILMMPRINWFICLRREILICWLSILHAAGWMIICWIVS